MEKVEFNEPKLVEVGFDGLKNVRVYQSKKIKTRDGLRLTSYLTGKLSGAVHYVDLFSSFTLEEQIKLAEDLCQPIKVDDVVYNDIDECPFFSDPIELGFAIWTCIEQNFPHLANFLFPRTSQKDSQAEASSLSHLDQGTKQPTSEAEPSEQKTE